MHPFKKETVFFDLETTSTDAQTAKIVEISMTKAIPGKEEFERFHSYVNPGIPIPKEASDVNHITDEMVKDAPFFKDIAQEIKDFIGDADLGGYNIKGYDLLNLTVHFQSVPMEWTHRGRKIYDGFVIFCNHEPRNLTTAYKKFCGKNLEDAHSASADTDASLEVFVAQMDYYEFGDLDQMSKEVTDSMVDLGNVLTKTETGEIQFRVGKYRGVNFEQVQRIDPGYLDWLIYKSTMSLDTKICVKQLMSGIKL